MSTPNRLQELVVGQEEVYRAPPGNQFLISVFRFEKCHRKRFAMLKGVKMSHVQFVCKLVTPLLENVRFFISQPIVQ